MKKKYKAPQCRIVAIDSAQLIAASPRWHEVSFHRDDEMYNGEFD